MDIQILGLDNSKENMEGKEPSSVFAHRFM